MLPIDYDKVNSIVTDRAKEAVQALKSEQAKYGMKHGTNGLDKIKLLITKRDGLPRKVAFKFKRSGVFREKGAGRGYGGSKGSSWTNAKGEKKTTNPKSLGKQGSGNRSAAPWFNPVVEKFADEIASDLADQYVEIALNSLKIK